VHERDTSINLNEILLGGLEFRRIFSEHGPLSRIVDVCHLVGIDGKQTPDGVVVVADSGQVQISMNLDFGQNFYACG
jgi:hypothetical protein